MTGEANSGDLRRANIALVLGFLDAINDSWNISRMRELVSDDFLFVIPFAPEWFPVRYEGRERALAFMDSVRELMEAENLHAFQADTCANDPGEVIVRYKSDTRMKRTNLPYRNDYVGWFRVREGKITYFAEHLDPCRFVVAIGGRIEPPMATT